MIFPVEADTISHGIQLAVAPVFLLTAVAGMIGVVANRLARIIDRARLVEGRLKECQKHADDNAQAPDAVAAWKELGELRTRGLLANGSIGLLTLCAFLIGGTIVVLFLGETVDLPMLRVSIVSFLSALVCFMLALACFFAETMIATRLLNFGKNHKKH
jgi:hypothetical protein